MALPLVILGGAALTAGFFYPGYLNGDSNWQYEMIRTGRYSALHPVLMTWLWGVLDHVIQGSGGWFLFTTLLFWTGLASTVFLFTRRTWELVVATAIIGVFPPVFAMLSQIHKDTAMGAGMLAGFALLLLSERRRSLFSWSLALTGFWFALAIRYNAASAVLPFAIVAGFLLVRDHLPANVGRHLATPLRKSGVGLAIFAALVALSELASGLILPADIVDKRALRQYLLTTDLVGISVRSDRKYLPDLYYEPPLSLDELRTMHDDRTCYYLFWGSKARRKIYLLAEEEHYLTVRDAWWRAIASEPAAYLGHRLALFLPHLGIEPLWRVIQFPHFPRTMHYYGPRVFGMPHNAWMVRTLEKAGQGISFVPWPYVLLSILCALVGCWTRARHLGVLALLATSAMLYWLPYLLIGVSSEFRYMWWPILASLVQLVVLLDGLRRGDGNADEPARAEGLGAVA